MRRDRCLTRPGGCVYQRDGTRDASGERLHGASDPSALRGGGSAGIRSNPMATMMKTPERELHDYISEISERADVRAGSPLPLGTQETEEELISPFSAVTPAAFDWSCSTIPKMQRPRDVPESCNRNHSGEFGRSSDRLRVGG